ncbi:hypothetical protein KR009_006216 [Drosophila setifemur]|nr:hypothetical protein KR009_006216 [Drosophila setifemur]
MAHYTPKERLASPPVEEFGFPYPPYLIQGQLMQELFQVLELGKVGIFESPTGTGKSLTLTCAALTWLAQHEALVERELLQRIGQVEKELAKLDKESEQATDWLGVQGRFQVQREELRQLKHLMELLEKREQQLKEIKDRVKQNKRRRVKQVQQLREKDMSSSDSDSDHETSDKPEDSPEDRYRSVQIFFCSRTHSQLAQIVSELRKTSHHCWVRCISLGSRSSVRIPKCEP